MSDDIMKSNLSPFEKIKRINNYGNEYWSARELMVILDYSEYRNFLKVIKRAVEACEKSGVNKDDHFGQVNEMVEIGSNTRRNIDNYHLTRYACYLSVQNADSSKEVIALGQTYFAIQTRKQELSSLEIEDERRLFLRNELKNHNTKLADAARSAGIVEPIDYAVFQNHGYKGLYGGLDQKSIHSRKRLKSSQKILDHMGSTELAANLFRATQTEDKIRRENIKGTDNANKTHYEVGLKVRQTIKDLGGTMPEDLPTEKSIKELEKIKVNISKKIPNEIMGLTGLKGIDILNEDASGANQKNNEISIISEIADQQWVEIVNKLKDNKKMALYSHLYNSKATMSNNTIKIYVDSEFSKIYITKNIKTIEEFVSCILGDLNIAIEIA